LHTTRQAFDAAETVDAVDSVDASYLQTLLGYNARRVSLQAIELFTHRMERFSITPVDFSVLSLIRHNPGITSSQLCATLGLLPPNLVGKISVMEKRDLLLRKPHPEDGRAMGLYLTAAGSCLMADAEPDVTELEAQVSSKLTLAESKTLLRLLQKVYL
jgi:DNA-binding MarR family transcriptional regulator